MLMDVSIYAMVPTLGIQRLLAPRFPRETLCPCAGNQGSFLTRAREWAPNWRSNPANGPARINRWAPEKKNELDLKLFGYRYFLLGHSKNSAYGAFSSFLVSDVVLSNNLSSKQGG